MTTLLKNLNLKLYVAIQMLSQDYAIASERNL